MRSSPPRSAGKLVLRFPRRLRLAVSGAASGSGFRLRAGAALCHGLRVPAIWTAIIVTGTAEVADSVASFLLDRGAPGVQTESRDNEVEVVAHFAGDAPIEAVQRFCGDLPELFPGVPPPRLRVETVREDLWAESWKEHFPALRLGERLFVHPPWVTEIPAGRVGILIDPGMAFGTGQHATTRGCLILLERCLAAFPAQRVVDLGTGSGILAIAAAKLGAETVWAVDIDPDACRIAAENATANGVADRVRVCGSLAGVPTGVDLVLANILAQPLIELAPRIATLLRPSGSAIGSGLLGTEEEAVVGAWSAAGLVPHGRHAEGEWVAVCGVKC